MQINRQNGPNVGNKGDKQAFLRSFFLRNETCEVSLHVFTSVRFNNFIFSSLILI